MKCQSSDLNPDGCGFIRCSEEAVHRLWCPTWITAEKGVMLLCERHARNFMPEYNKCASGGTFYWGDDAEREFQKAYPGRPVVRLTS